jgi:hypothetical protein
MDSSSTVACDRNTDLATTIKKVTVASITGNPQGQILTLDEERTLEHFWALCEAPGKTEIRVLAKVFRQNPALIRAWCMHFVPHALEGIC